MHVSIALPVQFLIDSGSRFSGTSSFLGHFKWCSARLQLRAMTKEELKERTKLFGVESVKFARTLPRDPFTAHFASNS
jgi:hypothetical protein